MTFGKYIALEQSSPLAAENMINGIIDSINILKDFSQTGTTLHLPNGLNSGYRFIQFKRYLIFYRTHTNNIFVDRILNSNQDYLQILFKN